jgi:hypothetical protein
MVGSGASFIAASPNAYGADAVAGGADSGGPAGADAFGLYVVGACDGSLNYDDYFGQVGYATPGGSTYEAPGTEYNSSGDIADSYYDYTEGHGSGPGAYFFMAGPSYSPPDTTAYQWGEDQGLAAVDDFLDAQSATDDEYKFNFIFADIEGIIGTDGWISNTASNANVWNGFVNWLQTAGYNVGAYSAPDAWSGLLGNPTVEQVEWTYELNTDPGSPTPCPTQVFSGGPGYGTNATFFHPANTHNNLVWQWSINSGQGDFDHIDQSRWNALFGDTVSP